MNAFITGSHAYGIPDADSDLDLVILLSDDDFTLLCGFYVAKGGEGLDLSYLSDDSCGISLRFGELNILCVNDARDWETWRKGTHDLVAMKPVSRETAVEVFQRLRKEEAGRRRAEEMKRMDEYSAQIEAEMQAAAQVEELSTFPRKGEGNG